jgi:hypothetical protein
MNTTCGNCSCNQGRACSLSAASVRSRILSYIICSCMAVALVVIISASQALEDYDEQAAQSQVMACSQFPVECRAFAEAHASAPANRR